MILQRGGGKLAPDRSHPSVFIFMVLSDTAETVAIVLFYAEVFMYFSESISPVQSELDMLLYR